MIGRIAVTMTAVIALTAACSSSGGSGNPPASLGSTAAGGASAITLSLHNGKLVGADGRTLYVNSADTTTHVICTGSCTSQWPPVDGKPTAGAGVSASKISSFTRPDGTVQATYAGHPLYEFQGDSAPGDTNGKGITDAGGTWTVAGAAAAPPASAPSTSTGGGGYTYP
jgi:predicted lipoprotein with Yx(FWY)xxD motif